MNKVKIQLCDLDTINRFVNLVNRYNSPVILFKSNKSESINAKVLIDVIKYNNGTPMYVELLVEDSRAQDDFNYTMRRFEV